MKRSLLFLLFLILFSTVASSQQVIYSQNRSNYNAYFNTTYANTGDFATNMQIRQWAAYSTDSVVAWRPFTIDGGYDTTKKSRALKVGDVFTIYGSFIQPKGTIGIALLSSPTSEANWSDRINNYALSVNLDGPDVSGSGNWYVKAKGVLGGDTTYKSSTQIDQTTYHEYMFQFTLQAPDRMTVYVEMDGNEILDLDDVQLNTRDSITAYSIYLNDGGNNSSGSIYEYWGTNSSFTHYISLPTTLEAQGAPYLGPSGTTFTESNIIPDGLSADGTSVSQNSLTIYGPGTVTLTAANTYTGNTIIDNDNYSQDNGTLILSHPGGNTLLATSNVTVKATETLQISSNQTLNNLTLASGGTLIIDNGDTLIINGALLTDNGSTITNNGNIVIAPNASFLNSSSTSNVTLQQSITAQRGYRIFANPFSTTQTNLSGTGLNATVTTANDVKTYDNVGDTWVSAGSGYNSLTTIGANTPYACFIRGASTDYITGANYTSGPTAFTYSVTGILNTGSVTITPSVTNNTNFFLVGNPFAAPITSSALTNGAGVPYYVYTISPGSTQTEQQTKTGSWSAQISSSTSTTIPMLGAIIYQPSSISTYPYYISSSSIDTTSSRRIAGLFGEVKNSNPISYLELQVESQGNYQDKLFVRLDNNATINSNDKIDLAKFPNDNVNVYTITPDNKHLAIDARNSFEMVPLGLKASNTNYTFRVNNNSLPDGTIVYLVDKYSNTNTELVTGATYNFSVTSDSSSQGEKRFELQFNTNKTTATIDNSISDGKLSAIILGNVTSNNQVTVQISGNLNPVTIKVIDMNGKVVNVVRGINGTINVNIGQAASGMTLLQISDGKNTIVKKVIKM